MGADASGLQPTREFDSYVLVDREPFVDPDSQILAQTSRVVVGPLVTNPLTRDPSVTVLPFATLNDTFGNRTVCGIGRGDSRGGCWAVKPASLALLSERCASSGNWRRAVRVDCRRHPGADPVGPRRPLDIWMAGIRAEGAAHGGGQADGFILQCADPDIARWTIGSVRAAACRGPRPGRG